MCIFLKAKSIVVGRPWAIDQALRERWIHPTPPPPKHRWATDPSSFQCFGCSDFGEGEGVRINPNIVRIVMHIEIYGRSLTLGSLGPITKRSVLGPKLDC